MNQKEKMDRLFTDLIGIIDRHEKRVGESLNFTASENRLSPCARLPLISDVYNRYFLDDLRLFGNWVFLGGKDINTIEQEFLQPILKKLTRSKFVNTRPISGINCMQICLVATTEVGDNIVAIPVESGGHASTRVNIEMIGRNFLGLPMKDAHTLDLDQFTSLLRNNQISLVYIDQSTFLFPIDPNPLRAIIDRESPATILHYDSSHLNGLIFGNAVFNPLERGAHLFGGSTHKTFPGPHKGFVATNCSNIAERINKVAEHFVSHHHSGEAVSLAVTLVEFYQCGGDQYAQQIIENARTFAETMYNEGLDVVKREQRFTDCHQVWVSLDQKTDIEEILLNFEMVNIITNRFSRLPGIDRPSLRLSLAEITRMGGKKDHSTTLAKLFADIILKRRKINEVQKDIESIRPHLSKVCYCFGADELRANGPLACMRKILQKNMMGLI